MRIRTVCVDDPSAHPDVLEPGVRDLVLSLHGRWGVRVLASCQGHFDLFAPGRHSDAYVYLHCAPALAVWVHALLDAAFSQGLLHRAWGVHGHMHPDLGLCFAIEPFDAPSLISPCRQDRDDLFVLTQMLPQTCERTAVIDPNADYCRDDYQKKAKLVVATYIERIGVPAMRARFAHFHSRAQWLFAFLAGLKRHVNRLCGW